MNVAIVGCGAVGQKRARVIGRHKLVVAVDTAIEMAARVADICNCQETSTDWRSVVKRKDVDLVIVATTNNYLTPVVLAAVENGKHVLVEKPAARSPGELMPVIEEAVRNGVYVRVGFNLRYHPAIRKAKEIADSGSLGPLMFIRGRYGHGGRKGYDKEWRADTDIAGGGELLDQGVHLIDLSRWFLGEFDEISGYAHTYFWDMPVEDNAFLMLKTGLKQVAWLHVSCTEWKNMFSLEIYGRDAKLHVEGLGGSYGTERLTYYKMLPQMGPPETTSWEYPFPDNSWQLEFEEFVRGIEEKREMKSNLEDARAALEIVHKIYGGMKE
ncbi:MAG: Gfo/Idh/MocA family protein [Desulfocucumaceae bacterium]